MKESGDAASAPFLNILNKSNIIYPGNQEEEVRIRCSLLIIILSLSHCLSYRAKPNSKDILPKRVPFTETELPESKLCKMASTKLPKTISYLWRQVSNSPYAMLLLQTHLLLCLFLSEIVTKHLTE